MIADHHRRDHSPPPVGGVGCGEGGDVDDAPRRGDDDDGRDDDGDHGGGGPAGTPLTPAAGADDDPPDDDDDDDDRRRLLRLRTRRRVAGAIALSMAVLWAYSRHHRRESAKGRRRSSSSLRRDGRGGTCGMLRWAVRLLSSSSPWRISTHLLRRFATSDNAADFPGSYRPPPPPSSSVVWKNATAVPLGHLLAMARAGEVSRVVLRGSALAYLHSMTTSPPSSSSPPSSGPKRQQRWSRTALPSNNAATILDGIIATLLERGCDDITTMPESALRRFLDGPAVAALPFAYLAALYWTMKRLQRNNRSGEEGDNGETAVGGKRRGGNTTTTTITFDDVAGIESSMRELSEVVSYLRDPSSFRIVGARPPMGVLLHGPPGSGKTLLARAIAGEAGRRDAGVGGGGDAAGDGDSATGIDCFAACSGSEFVDTYVGRGASRVRGLFRDVREEAARNFARRIRGVGGRRRRGGWWVHGEGGATTGDVAGRGAVSRMLSGLSDGMTDVWDRLRSLMGSIDDARITRDGENSQHRRPTAIVFIDEIDCLAKRRDSGMGSIGGGCDEREQTLNQLLTEMDGFDTGGSSSSSPSSSVDVIVIAATNRPEVLDPAIMRRFDRHVRVALPDARGREAILRVHARRVRWDRSSVDFAVLPTGGFSGSDLKNLINEAALLAVRCGSSRVTQAHLLEAARKVRAIYLGHESSPRHRYVS